MANMQLWSPMPLGGTDVNAPEWLKAHVLRLLEGCGGCLASGDLHDEWQCMYGFPLDLDRYQITDVTHLEALLTPDASLTEEHGHYHLQLVEASSKKRRGQQAPPDDSEELHMDASGPNNIDAPPAGSPEALDAAVPLIVESMAQLHDSLCSTITKDWDRAHAVALKAALDAHMHTTAGQAGHTTAMDMLKGLLKMAQFITGMPTGQAGTATPNDMEADMPASPIRRPALRVSSERLRAAVLETAQALDCGCGLAAFAALEAAVLARFNVAAWHELTDSSSSLVQLLQADAALMEAVTGGPDAVAMVPLEQVLQLVAQALMCSVSSAAEPSQEDAEGAKQTVVATCLCATFHVPRVEQLGHGSVQRLLQLCSEQQIMARRSPVNIHALAAGVLPAAEQGAGMVGTVDCTAAVECLRAAPDLADLQQWSQWNQVYAPTLGPLHHFLSTEGERHGIIALEVMGDSAVSGVRLPGMRLLKLRSNASTQEFAESCTRGDARGAVCTALSLAVQSGGVNSAPLAYMGSLMETSLRAMAAEGATRQDDGAQAGPSSTPAVSAVGIGRAAAFAMRCLALLPQPIAAAVASQLVLQPLAQVIGGPAAAQAALLQAAKGAMDEEGSLRSVLHALAWPLGITTWQEDWRQSRTVSAPSQLQQVPAVAGSGLAAGPGASGRGGAVGASDGDATLVDEVLSRLAAGADGLGLVVDMDITASAASSAPAGEPTAATPPANEEACRSVVEQIRHDEFGMGVQQANQEAAKVHDRQNERMGRALARLSRELYSVDTHFVLELVQNADDNRYLHSLPPALEFVLQPGSITVLNNEGGFSAKDVRALCDVGLSTKTKAGGGFIGQKGIGFKSVFKVTDAPQVHSNGFHVKFDLVAHPALGYVLPTWVDKTERHTTDTAARASRIGLASAFTRITLPLKSTVMESDGGLSLRQRFGDVHPTLLLFLQKLQMLAITDTVDAQRSTVMVRRQLEHGLVELRHGPAAEHLARWLVVDSTVKPNLMRLGETLDTTRVALGFCLEGATPCQQQVFAFLPLRSYGLRFVVQGDFVVPTSREALDNDSAWNQMLRSEIPSLFARALESFMRLPPADNESGRWAWVDRWLRCIPLDGEAQGFFSALPHSIASLLRAMPCIPADDDTLMLPGDALYCNTPSMRQLFLGHQLQALLGKRFVSPEVEVLATSPQLRALLGVHELSPLETLEHLKAMIESPQGQAELHRQGAPYAQRLLLAMFDMVDSNSSGSSRSHLSQQQRAQVQQLLQSLQLLPLLGGGWASVTAAGPDAMSETPGAGSQAAAPIFFALPQPHELAPTPLPAKLVGIVEPATPTGAAGQPASRSGNSLLAATDKTARTLHKAGFKAAWLQSGPHALRFVSPELLAGLDPHSTARLVHGLQSMGIKELSALEVAQLHVLPAMAERPAEDWPVQRLVANLALFVVAGLLQPGCEVEQDTEEQRLLQQLKESAVIALSIGGCRRSGRQGAEPVLLPKGLGGAADWQAELPGQWLVPAAAYATLPPAVLPAWKWLLGELGLQRLPPLLPVQHTVSCAQQHLPQPWASLPPGALNHGLWLVADWSCPLLERLAKDLMASEKGESTVRWTERLVRLIDDNWDTYGPVLSATCTSAAAATSAAAGPAAADSAALGPASASEQEAHTLPSSFAMCLRNLQLPSARHQLLPPFKLIMQSEPTVTMFGSDVDYLKRGVARQELAAALGVVCEVDAACVLDVLRRWSAQAAGAGMVRSPRRMAALYRFLSDACARDAAVLQQVRSAFLKRKLVWMPARVLLEPQHRAQFRPQDHQRRQQQQQQQAAAETREAPMTGCFMALDQLCLYDPSGMLETLPVHVVPLRVVLCAYPSLSRFFAEQLGRSEPIADSSGSPSSAFEAGIRAFPDVEDYTRVVRAIAQQPQHVLDNRTWGGVLPVLLMWAKQLAAGQLQPEQLVDAAAQLADAHVLRAVNGGRWVSLNQKPYLLDDTNLADLLANEFGVHLLAVPDDATLQEILTSSTSGQQTGQAAVDGGSVVALLAVMGVQRLSLGVVREVLASGAVRLSDVYFAVADVLPYLQRYLMEYWGEAEYVEREDGVLRTLDAFKCQSAERLEVVYTLPVTSGPPARSVPVQRQACLKGNCLLLHPDTHITCEEVAQELSRLFNGGIEDVLISDTIFSLLMGVASGADLEAVIRHAGVPPEHQASMLVNSWELGTQAWATLLGAQELEAEAQAAREVANDAAAAAVVVPGDEVPLEFVQGDDQAEPSLAEAAVAAATAAAAAAAAGAAARKRARESTGNAGNAAGQQPMAAGPSAAQDAAVAGTSDQRPAKRQRGNPAAALYGAAAAHAPGQAQPMAMAPQPNFNMGVLQQAVAGAWASVGRGRLQAAAGKGGLGRSRHAQAAWQKRAEHHKPRQDEPGAAAPTEADLIDKIMRGAQNRADLRQAFDEGRITVSWVSAAVLAEAWATLAHVCDGVWADADSAGAQVGRWGEKVAYLHLREKYKGTAKVDWINGVEESGGPFDVTVRPLPIGRTRFIEVKATMDSNKLEFKLSRREFQYAENYGPEFSVLRVVGALGTHQGAVYVMELVDPIGLWRDRVIDFKTII